jgi:uncharacterized protein YcfL
MFLYISNIIPKLFYIITSVIMKKIILLVLATALLASCGTKDETAVMDVETPVVVEDEVVVEETETPAGDEVEVTVEETEALT